MQIGVPRETGAGETRVAATPETVKKLTALGHTVRVESQAGAAASAIDAAYSAVGAEITDRAGAFGCEVVLKVRAPNADEAIGDERRRRFLEHLARDRVEQRFAGLEVARRVVDAQARGGLFLDDEVLVVGAAGALPADDGGDRDARLPALSHAANASAASLRCHGRAAAFFL